MELFWDTNRYSSVRLGYNTRIDTITEATRDKLIYLAQIII